MRNIYTNRWFALLVALLLLANMVTLVMLWSHQRNRDEFANAGRVPSGPAVEYLIRELQFDSVQQVQFQQLRETHQSLQMPLQANLHNAKDTFYNLLSSNQVTDSLLLKYSTKISAIEQQMDLARFKHFQSLRAICHPAQQIKFDKIIKEVIQNMQGGRGRKGPPPGSGHGPPEGIDGPLNEPPGPPMGDRPLPPSDRRN